MKYSLKALTVLMIIMLAMSVFAGCSQNNQSEGNGYEGNEEENVGTSNKEEQQVDEDPEKTGELQLPLTDEPITYDLMIDERPKAQVNNDWEFLKALEERTNVKLKLQGVPKSGYQEKKKIMIATGSVPDFMVVEAQDIYDAGPDGAFLRLNELIDKYAPNIKRVLKEYPETKVINYAPDGGIYAIPNIGRSGWFNFAWQARKDLMDQYNLQAPKTPEEFYQFLKVFKEHNPEKYPFTTRYIHKNWVSVIYEFGKVFTGIYRNGSDPVSGFNPEQDKFEYIFQHPNSKEMLVYLHKLYEEGLMDPEVPFLKPQQFMQKMVTGNGFVSYDYHALIETLATQAKEIDPNTTFEMTALPPFSVEGIKPYQLSDTIVESDHLIVLSPDIEHPEVAIKLLDYLYSEEGSDLTNLGILGKTYEIVDGKPKFLDVVSSEGLEKTYMENMGFYYEGLNFYGKDKFEQTIEISSKRKESFDIYEDYLIAGAKQYKKSEKTIELEKSKGENVRKYIDEQMLKFIMGQEPITDQSFNEFVEKSIEIGAMELIDAYNKDYQAAHGK